MPDAVRDAVHVHLGDVTVVREVGEGQNCNLAVVVRGSSGDVFLKGVTGVSPRMRWLRNEAAAGELAPGIAPATKFSEDVEPDWLIVGSEFVEGRPADLSPDSADLGVISATMAEIGSRPAGWAQPLSQRWASSDWWEKLDRIEPDEVAGWDIAAMTQWSALTPELLDGAALLHTDLHEHQFLINDAAGGVRVIDWGRPAAGAPWVDVAFLVIRLVAAGHAPAAAERWAETAPTWSGTDKAVAAFACYVAGLWSYRGATSPFPGSSGLSAAARVYARYRLTK
ncbi:MULTISPECIES: phosphotransferase [unclassified Amycolatopsis]|uniref:phosphotransferase n=1 Tax=unclassified Amycolatopsis TaxID=2618356 RepID=UPI00210785C8|nr:phosphotransferase [Amycolatopsis sp. DSM 110486]